MVSAVRLTDDQKNSGIADLLSSNWDAFAEIAGIDRKKVNSRLNGIPITSHGNLPASPHGQTWTHVWRGYARSPVPRLQAPLPPASACLRTHAASWRARSPPR